MEHEPPGTIDVVSFLNMLATQARFPPVLPPELNCDPELRKALQSFVAAANTRITTLDERVQSLENVVVGRSIRLSETIEDLVKARKKAESASRAKSEFLANMSHEVRTPLNIIVTLSKLILDTELDLQQRNDIETIISCVHSLKTIIDDILDFSKIEAGKLLIEKTRFRPKRAIKSTLEFIESQLYQKRQIYAVEIAEDLPRFVLGDPTRFRQILTNLLSNAIKFTPEEGLITVRAKVESKTDKQVIIQCSVQDSGIGIAPEKREAIFEAFAQADGSTTRRFGGTGLGLAICIRLLSMMGGNMRVDDNPKGGAIFSFSIPFGVYESEDSPETLSGSSGCSDVSPDTKTLRILIAEDNSTSKEAMLRLLSNEGHVVSAVSDGREVICRLENEPYDVVLMDLHMPKMGGIEATKRIRAADGEPYQSIPIYALTAHAIKGVEQQCMEAGMNGYITKPVEFARLFKALDNVARQKPAANESCKERIIRPLDR